MLTELLLAASIQVGPFWQSATDYSALRPIVSSEGESLDVLWPLFTSHRDWWRFCFIVHGQSSEQGDSQFDIFPIWYNGHTREGETYAGLFPIYGTHPGLFSVYDIEFALWPLWTRYARPRNRTGEWLETKAVLFPFFHWRSDGSWGAWPFYGVHYQRESDHRYALWPLVTWATYREDRDTSGAGYSWMVWPLCAEVDRERERQWLFLPPLFSKAETLNSTNAVTGVRWRLPWPFFEYERSAERRRLSVFPFYEQVDDFAFRDGRTISSTTRFGWKLVELYDDETRVFPFWVSRDDGSYFRLWPLWENAREGDVEYSRTLALFPIRWVPAVDRNWSKFWTFYERVECPVYVDHSLLWGLIRWRTFQD